MSASVTLDIDGKPVTARMGESIAAVLTRAGIRSFRDTAQGDARGLFCGMGVCQDCLVSIDGLDNQRACMSKVGGAHVVRRQEFPGRARAPSASAPIIEAGDLQVRRPDVVVIGGGAGGLSAAAAAAEAGASVVLIDERDQLGGQYYKQPALHRAWSAQMAGDAQFRDGRALIRRVERAGVELMTGTQAWGGFAPRTIAAANASGTILLEPARLIVACGAYERGVPVPGWTLPGVMTAGSAQTLLRKDGVLPGRRIVVCGNGPLNLQIALELAEAGAEVAAVAELAARPGLARLGAVALMLRAAPGLVWQGLKLSAGLHRHGIPVLHGHGLMRVESGSGGLTASLGRFVDGALAPARTVVVDAVLMGYGFLPSNELLRSLGCRHAFDPQRGCLVPVRDEDGETSVAGVQAIGDCCGLGGAAAAMQEGTIAGVAAARAVGRGASAGTDRMVRRARRMLVRHRSFQRGLWEIFAAPSLQAELTEPDTVICRCEEVTRGDIDAALDDGRPSIGEVKRRTRLAMGRCQGRYCTPVLAAMMAKRQGRDLDEQAFFAPRVPLKPIAISDLVRAASLEQRHD